MNSCIAKCWELKYLAKKVKVELFFNQVAGDQSVSLCNSSTAEEPCGLKCILCKDLSSLFSIGFWLKQTNLPRSGNKDGSSFKGGLQVAFRIANKGGEAENYAWIGRILSP